MEDSSPLKIRSDLYPHARAPQNMTSTSDSAPTVPHKMTPSATLSQQCKPSDNEKEQKKEEDLSDKTLSPQQYSSPPRNVNWGPTTGVSGDDCEKRKSSQSPSSNACRRTPTESAIESSSVEPNEENENWEDVPQRADSPLEHSPSAYSQGTPYRLPHGIQETNENIMVNREYASPLAASVDKTAIPPLSFHPFIHTRTESETCYNERSPQSSDHEEPIEVGEEETLDLSLSTRSKESKMSHLPTSPTPPPAPFNPFVAFPGLAARFHEMNPMFHDGYEQGVPKSPFASSLYGSNLPPHLIPWIISSQIQNLVQQQQAARAEGNRANILESCNGAISLEDRDQQPLDLSAKKQDEPKILAPEDDLVARVLEMKPSTRGRRRADNSKRSYTDFELHAALREIQSGKLGTRKAAVKYGIPRSTLRNKVYKLQLVRDSAKNATDQKNNLASTLPDSTATCRAPLFPSKPPECDANEDNQSEALKSIIRKKMTEKLDELSRSSQTYLSGGDQQRLVESALMYLFENIPKLALNSDNKDVPSDVLSSLSLYPQLHDFTQKIVEERFYEELKRINNNSSNEPKLPEVANGYNFDSGTTPINIPSYPSIYKCNPSTISMRTEDLKSGSNSSHPTCTSPPQGNLKDMIAQIINQKILGEEVPGELPNSATASPPFLPLSVQRMESPFLKAGVKISEEMKNQQDPNKKRAKSPSSGGGKGSRPKRGKYRNYDRDNLLKAVQAVQSGEMSVHRAGSFYGVPHSTLEYKVKERHLNRGKSKKDNVGASNVPILKAEKENSTFNSTIPTSAFSKEYKTDTPDTTTKELLITENRCNNDEISIISVHSPPAKKVRKSDPNESFTNLPITSNPFLSGPFPFWNNTSPILAPFLSHPYQTDPLYASQVMTNFQKAASKLNNLDSRQNSPSPNNSDTKYAETSSTESSLNRIQGLFSNGGGAGGGGGGSISSTPPSSPPIQDGLLNSLLRKKFESQLNESRVPWSINPVSGGNNQREEIKENKNDLESNVVPQAGLLTLKALLPSFIAARTSLAAAAAIAADNTIPTASKQPSSPPQPASPLPMINESVHRPVVSGICGTPISETQ